jgi:purine-nucleoside phosphorylase
MDLEIKIQEAINEILRINKVKPKIGLVLGSGLGEMAEEMEDEIIIPYKSIPGFPLSTVEGHAGNLVFGKISDKHIVAMQGRFHYYEGYSMEEVTFPIRIMAKLGIEYLIVTNAAGGINEKFKAGDLMIIEDMINLQGNNPLIGINLDDFGVRFPDLSKPFNKEMQDIIFNCAVKNNVTLKKGVYAAMSGPSFETPAEIRMLRKLGADAVGMSTVPEVIVARHSGIKVLGVSCISNMAAGILQKQLNHKEVIETTDKVKDIFKKLIRETIRNI